MFNTKRRWLIKTSAAAMTVAVAPQWSNAQSTPYGPDDLKSTLTPLGAIRAGNADGTIPAWTGGYSTVPPGYEQGQMRADPFADEKPLFTITGANASQYQDKLPVGAMAMLQKYSDFRLDVYATHRTAIAPQYVYDNTYKNASTAQLSADGNSVSGAYGGIPFPIPVNGHQVMWNSVLSWQGTSIHFVSDAYVVTSAGELVFESRAAAWEQYPYYFENGESRFNGFVYDALIVPIAPPYQAGGSILLHQPVNPDVTPVEGWTYLVGQRRVRRAPELQYDTPDSLTGGVVNWDEAYIFNGKFDRYDFNLVGKKEMYVPYNMNKAWNAPVSEQYKANFFGPDISRWELHRVWVVEMTLKPGSRNVDARRTIYVDEDTGAALAGEMYDASGSLWKFTHGMPTICPDIPALITHKSYVVYDLHAGNYAAADVPNNEAQPAYKIVPEMPASFFTPGRLAASAGGF